MSLTIVPDQISRRLLASIHGSEWTPAVMIERLVVQGQRLRMINGTSAAWADDAITRNPNPASTAFNIIPTSLRS